MVVIDIEGILYLYLQVIILFLKANPARGHLHQHLSHGSRIMGLGLFVHLKHHTGRYRPAFPDLQLIRCQLHGVADRSVRSLHDLIIDQVMLVILPEVITGRDHLYHALIVLHGLEAA